MDYKTEIGLNKTVYNKFNMEWWFGQNSIWNDGQKTNNLKKNPLLAQINKHHGSLNLIVLADILAYWLSHTPSSPRETWAFRTMTTKTELKSLHRLILNTIIWINAAHSYYKKVDYKAWSTADSDCTLQTCSNYLSKSNLQTTGTNGSHLSLSPDNSPLWSMQHL